MSSVPLTPKTSRTTRSKVGTPKSILKRTILNFDPNLLYLEDDDASYIDEATQMSYDDDYDEDDEETSLANETFEVTDLLLVVAEDDESLITPRSKKFIISESTSTDDLATLTDTPTANTNEIPKIVSSASRIKRFMIQHEIVRKALHSSIGVFTLWLYTLGVHQTQLILPLSTLFAVIFANDFIRFRNPELNKKIVSTMWFLIREKEEFEYNGTLYFLIGLIIIFSFCPKDISLMSVLLLSWADTAALSFGRQFGKYTPKLGNGKSLAGSLASFATGVISCYILYGYFIPVYNEQVSVPGDIMWTRESSKLSFPFYAFLSGLIASLSELIDIGGIDDNFTIPVLSGSFLYVFVRLFHS